MMTKPAPWVDQLMGAVELRSWLEFRDGRCIGMGRVIRRDRDGRVLEDKTAPSGVEASWS